MMIFTILTLNPGLIRSYISVSILARAQERGLVKINVVDLRDHVKPSSLGDYPYGNRSCMVMPLGPVISTLRGLNLLQHETILLTPSGKPLSQDISRELSGLGHIVLVCGQHEGIDARISSYIRREISIGDYVLTSGELPALVIMDSVIRLIPGVISGSSLSSESFDDHLLDYPSYTRPRVFEGISVPDVLLGGNHREIAEFRLLQREKLTRERRPDLYQLYLKSKSKGGK